MKDYHINIFWSDENGGYIADIPDLEACSAFGATPAEALVELERAKGAWLEAARSEGKAIPVPRSRLEALADEALAEYRAGRTLPLDPDKL